jgi:hypothetical protein
MRQKQILILSIYGAILWFIAAMIVRLIAPMGALGGGWALISFALVIPGTVPAILIGQIIAGLRRNQIMAGTMIITASALLLDGIAHAWFHGIYGDDPMLAASRAAAIFWGAGVALILGMVMNSKM